jgi:LysM repeat protein
MAAVNGVLDLPVGYTDPVIALGAWPQTTAEFSVSPALTGGGAVLSVGLSFQSSALVAAPSEPAGVGAARALDLSARFDRIYFQVGQPDVKLTLSTSLNQPAGGEPIALAGPLGGLRAQAAAASAFAATAATLRTLTADPVVTATLGDVVSHYGLDWPAIAAANGTRTLGELITGTAAALPVFAVFKAGDTPAEVCPPELQAADLLKDPDNAVLPLTAGIELVVPARTITPDAALSLNAIATAAQVTPASLVRANAATTGLLRPGFVFSAQGVEVEVAADQPDSDVSLDEIAQTFAANGVPWDAVMVAVANGETLPGMFREGVTLSLNRYIVQPDETLAANGSGASVDQLADLNGLTIDLFPAGTPVFLSAPAVAPLDMPLADIATAYGIEPGEVLRHNAGAALKAAGVLVLPGMGVLPASPETLRVPYAIPPRRSLEAISGRFLKAEALRTPVQGLVAVNAALPGTVAGGQTIVVQGQSIPTEDGDSFDAVAARANPPITLDQLADAIADEPDVLAPGGLLLCPPAQLASGSGTTPIQAGARYSIAPAALLAANAAMPGLIQPGVTISAPASEGSVTLTTAPADSINAILRRFAQAGAAVTIEDLALTNGNVAMLAAGALMLLPPPPRRLEAAFGQSGWTFPGTIFPLRCWVGIERDADLVDPAFRGAPDAPASAIAAVSAVAARRSIGTNDPEDGAVTLNAFAADLETAIPGIRVATGKVLSAERQADPTDVWAVSFIAGAGIGKVALTPPSTVPGVEGPQPRSFALRPLSNVLESRAGVQIRLLDPATGLYGGTETRDYQGIDLETWARDFLADLDLFYSAPYAAPAYRVARAALALAIGAKADLAGAVADGLSPVLDVVEDTEIGGANWTAAREALRQELLVRLSRAYGIAAVIQFEAAVEALADTANAKLSGAGRILALDAAEGDNDSWKKAQLSTAKTPLAAGSWPVSFLLSVPDEAQHRSVTLSLEYPVNELEFGITPVVEGYDASDWLSFITPLSQTPPAALQVDLGQPVTPIPLRSYPPLAALVAQEAARIEHPAGVDEALRWTYVFAYRHQSAAQDEIRLEVEFNLRPPAAKLADANDDLFSRLAQYAAIAPQLWPILAGLTDPAAWIDPAVLANAIATYATLVRETADAWMAHWGAPAPVPQARLFSGAPYELYSYGASLDSQIIDSKPWYVSLTLRRVEDAGGDFWPEIEVIAADGTRAPLIRDPAGPSSDTLVYDFPAKTVEAFTPLSFELRFPALHIARYQSALAKVWVERNVRLLGPAGPQTREAFVYRTPALAFPEPLVPLIQIDDRLDIGTWTTVPETNPLNGVFDAIFDGDPDGRETSIAIRYGYALTPGPDPIETYLPVALQPRQLYEGVSPIIEATEDWDNANQPVRDGGLWAFAISLYSSLDEALDRPLLVLTRLVSPLT